MLKETLRTIADRLKPGKPGGGKPYGKNPNLNANVIQARFIDGKVINISEAHDRMKLQLELDHSPGKAPDKMPW